MTDETNALPADLPAYDEDTTAAIDSFLDSQEAEDEPFVSSVSETADDSTPDDEGDEPDEASTEGEPGVEGQPLEDQPGDEQEETTVPEGDGTLDLESQPEFIQKAIAERNYYGVDLSDFTDDAAAKLVVQLHDKWTKEVNRLQQENAELRKGEGDETPAIPADDETGDEPTMPELDELLEYFEYDLSDPTLDLTKPHLKPLLERQWVTEQYLLSQQQDQQLQAQAQYWTETFDRMEESYGPLPEDRGEVVKFAFENGIEDPEVAYIKYTEPYRKAAQDAAREARKSREKPGPAEPKKPVTARPQSKGGGKPTKPLSRKQAILQAEKDVGMDWGKMAEILREA